MYVPELAKQIAIASPKNGRITVGERTAIRHRSTPRTHASIGETLRDACAVTSPIWRGRNLHHAESPTTPTGLSSGHEEMPFARQRIRTPEIARV